MATVSERSRELADGIIIDYGRPESTSPLFEMHVSKVSERIEQALLAERRLAMELAIEEVLSFSGYGSLGDAEELALLIRAAAEKEVGK